MEYNALMMECAFIVFVLAGIDMFFHRISTHGVNRGCIRGFQIASFELLPLSHASSLYQIDVPL